MKIYYWNRGKEGKLKEIVQKIKLLDAKSSVNRWLEMK